MYLYTGRQLEFHQRVDSFRGRAVDIEDAFEGAQLELLTSLLVNEGRAVHGKNLLAGRKGYGTTYYCTRSFYGFDNLIGRLVYQGVVERLSKP